MSSPFSFFTLHFFIIFNENYTLKNSSVLFLIIHYHIELSLLLSLIKFKCFNYKLDCKIFDTFIGNIFQNLK